MEKGIHCFFLSGSSAQSSGGTGAIDKDFEGA